MEKLSTNTLRGREFNDSPAEAVLGEETGLLEQNLAEWVGAAHCVSVSDPVSGIALALKAAGVERGDRVICPALGCALPVQGVLLASATPLFADVNPDTYTLDPFRLEYTLGKLRSSGENMPVALIAVDLFGGPCHLAELEQVCQNYGIALIEDISGAFGASYLGRKVGSFTRFAVASFAAAGHLEEPSGGAVFCREKQDAAKVAALRCLCRQQSPTPGCRMPYMRSADITLTHLRLESFEHEQAGRQKAAQRYRLNLADKVQLQQPMPGGESVYSQFVVALPGGQRQRVMQQLLRQGIPCAPPPCGVQTFSGCDRSDLLTNARLLSDRLLSLPIYPHLSVSLVDFICEELASALSAQELHKQVH